MTLYLATSKREADVMTSVSNTVKIHPSGTFQKEMVKSLVYTCCLSCSASNKDLLTAVLSSEVPATPLGSFPAIFNQALALGTISRRRVYHEVHLLNSKNLHVTVL